MVKQVNKLSKKALRRVSISIPKTKAFWSLGICKTFHHYLLRLNSFPLYTTRSIQMELSTNTKTQNVPAHSTAEEWFIDKAIVDTAHLPTFTN